MSFTHDVLILGRGIAGVVLSETLAARGLRVLVFDAPQEGRASWVAAGVVNPIVLRRTVPSWRASEMLAIAGAFYRDLQLDYEARLWTPMPLVEIFPTAQEAGIWDMRLRDPELARMIAPGPAADRAVERIPQPYGHGVVTRCAWLDMKQLLNTHRERWLADGALIEGVIEEGSIIRTSEGIELLGHSAPLLVRCAGPFATLPGLVPVRGEGLTVRLRGLGLGCMLHRGLFMVPQGDDVYRIGSTFAWDDVWSGPTEEGRRSLLDKVSRLFNSEVEVLEHWAGVRPAAKDRRPLLGRIGPHEAVLNGLGSRGALLAPWCATHLADHLLNGAQLDPEVDLARFA